MALFTFHGLEHAMEFYLQSYRQAANKRDKFYLDSKVLGLWRMTTFWSTIIRILGPSSLPFNSSERAANSSTKFRRPSSSAPVTTIKCSSSSGRVWIPLLLISTCDYSDDEMQHANAKIWKTFLRFGALAQFFKIAWWRRHGVSSIEDNYRSLTSTPAFPNAFPVRIIVSWSATTHFKALGHGDIPDKFNSSSVSALANTSAMWLAPWYPMELLLKLSFLMVQDFEPASTVNNWAKQQQKRG